VSDAICPACDAHSFTELESIDLEQQHVHLAPDDVAMRSEMTRIARQFAAGYVMRECGNCGLHYANPMIGPGARWYALAYHATSLYPEKRWEFRRVAMQFNSNDVVGDLGCGSGSFLSMCITAGISCAGYDFSRDAVDECRRRGVPADLLNVGDSHDHVPASHRRFTALAAFHLLEHLGDPRWLFLRAAAMARDDCRLFVSVPSDRRASRLYQEQDFMDQPPHHLSRWTSQALATIGASCGWRLEQLEYEPLPLRTELWSRAVRMRAYRWVATAGAHGRRGLERACRYMLYPAAMLARARSDHLMTGFSMLACFRRVPDRSQGKIAPARFPPIGTSRFYELGPPDFVE
jgi:SAM-dependent methyltransferase